MLKRNYHKRNKTYWFRGGISKIATRRETKKKGGIEDTVQASLKEFICEDQEKTSCDNAEFCKFFAKRYNK